MKRIIILVVILFILIPVAAFAEYWASKQSNKVHYPSCKWAKNIKPYKLLKFSDIQDAKRSGYVACKVCKPR